MSNHDTQRECFTRRWPYPVSYGKEREVKTDVLILGGGIAGCHAAIQAAKKGASVVVVDKGPVIRSGSGGSGVDHWHNAFTNPCSKMTPDEVTDFRTMLGTKLPECYGSGHIRYIEARESWDALLDMEELGMRIRDVDDVFQDAEFRDEDSKLLFAYDYDGRHVIRVQGGNVKPCLYRGLKKHKVDIFDRVMATKLLTEGGEPGARVVGATGLHVRTGEFYIFKAKATVLCTAQPLRLWAFSTELQGFSGEHDDPNCSGDGCAMAWNAGATFKLMERSMGLGGAFRYPVYGTGNAHNTWYACSVVDANGKEIPWVDRDGRILETISERYLPAPGQKCTLHDPDPDPCYEIQGPGLIPDLPERIKKGEFSLPFYADLPGMPEHERRAIFGLMVGHEGKTRIAVYENYTQAGFDPDRDMLQANVLPPEMAGRHMPWWNGIGPPQWRGFAFIFFGGVIVDWDLRTSLEGLYGAGNQVAGAGTHTIAATSGRYAGRKAAEYALQTDEGHIRRSQIEAETARVYAPVNRGDGIGWKELQAGLSRIMQDYCGEYKSGESLKAGLTWLESIKQSEASNAYARNPHELMRVLECFSRLTVGEMIMHASLARKASSDILDFKRLDYPDVDPEEWKKYVTIQLKNGDVKVGELPLNYWLENPYASTYRENYERHCGLY